MSQNYHNFQRMSTAVLYLVALAFVTDRILVLPPCNHFQKQVHIWEFLDMSLVGRYIDWRPTSFW